MLEINSDEIERYILKTQTTSILLISDLSCSYCEVAKGALSLINKKAPGFFDLVYSVLPENDDANADAREALKIKGFPTILMIRGGKVIAQKRGVMGSSIKENFRYFGRWIERNL